MLEKAANNTKADYARAMDLAHKLTLQLRAAEDRVRDLETEIAIVPFVRKIGFNILTKKWSKHPFTIRKPSHLAQL